MHTNNLFKAGFARFMLKRTKGYTLIELIVVIVLIGIVMTLAMPRFRYSLLTDDLKSTTRKLTGMIMNLKNEAIRNQKIQELYFDLESNRCWVETPDMTEEEQYRAREKSFDLPTGVRIMDIVFRGEGKKMIGETLIRFTKKGYIQPSIIHLGSEDGREFTLVLNPFLGSVKVLKEYADIENY